MRPQGTLSLNSIIDGFGAAGTWHNKNYLHPMKKENWNLRRLLLNLIRGKTIDSPGQWIGNTKPEKVSLDLSTYCQLKCVSCPTSNQMVSKGIGSGFLSFENFRKFLQDHLWIKLIEISNWGEVLLNPEFIMIIKWAHQKGVGITIDNGVNLNSASDEVLESLVKYHVRTITCSIDGASQETYSKYRIRGNFNKVISNIKKINSYKLKSGSDEPVLTWQFVAFGHNEHEIGKAREMATNLGLRFKLKLSWDDLYLNNFSPVKDKELIRRESKLDVSSRKEFEEKYGRDYAGNCCLNLWTGPIINFDGKLLGCCINYWDDYGNVFEEGLESCLKKERYEYAKQMVMGLVPARDDIPCSKCKIYKSREKHGSYITVDQVRVTAS